MSKAASSQSLVAKTLERAWSNFALLMTAVGWSVGAGNYWRFSWRAANYGGGSFLLTYLVWLIIVAFPIAVAEYAIGKLGRGGPVHGPFNLAERHKKWAAFGGMWMAWADFMIMCYYWVVTGWIFYYMLHAVAGTFFTPGFNAVDFWKGFGYTPTSLFVGAFMMFLSILVTALGIKGIGQVAKFMFPLLFIFTVGLAVFTVTLPGAEKGLEFYMVPRPEALADPSTWMQSLSQVIWSIGIAWGFFICAGAWMRKNDDPTFVGFGNVVNDTAVAWVAGTAIIPLIFAVSATPYEDIKAAGEGLAFIVLPQLFRKMGPVGQAYAALFFIAFWFAAFTSLITIHEVALRPLKDFGLKTPLAALITGVLAFVCGLPTALSGYWLDYYDTVWGIVGLSLGLVFIALITSYFADISKVREKLMDIEIKPFIKLGKWWDIMVKVNIVIPPLFFIWWIVYGEWIRGWGAGLHTYYTFPGMVILIIGGAIMYFIVSASIDKQLKSSG
ncbi:MAG: sodium-dependent transporter [Sulfolobales archaeon]|nr:sodium-dependent transporter [Sulfolobales archaeon]MDW8082571.1 sodium-dependent transporter [Sulfolobales archaeon]